MVKHTSPEYIFKHPQALVDNIIVGSLIGLAVVASLFCISYLLGSVLAPVVLTFGTPLAAVLAILCAFLDRKSWEYHQGILRLKFGVPQAEELNPSEYQPEWKFTGRRSK